jgi:hypothetical protein
MTFATTSATEGRADSGVPLGVAVGWAVVVGVGVFVGAAAVEQALAKSASNNMQMKILTLLIFICIAPYFQVNFYLKLAIGLKLILNSFSFSS